MALAKQCDRCKKLYISKGIKINDQLVNTLITAEQDIANIRYMSGMFKGVQRLDFEGVLL